MANHSGQRVKFGNWMSTAPATIMGVTFLGWIVLLVTIMLAVGVMAVGRYGTAGLMVLFAVLFILLFVVRWGEPDQGRTVASRVAERVSHMRRVDRGESKYVTGLFSQLPDDALTALPGALVDVEELEGHDGENHPYVLLHHKSTSALAATFMCTPDGTDLHPQSRVDTQVAHYGGWVAALSRDPSLKGAVVVVDSARSSTVPLVEKIRSEVSDSAPELAKQALIEGAEALPGAWADIQVYATGVWSVPALATNVEDAAAEVAAKLPDHRAMLRSAGSGAAVVADSEDLARAVRVAYDPRRSREFGTDDLLGNRNPVSLSQAGPEFFDDSQRRVCFHDGVASMTAMMTVPPQMHITEETMKSLFAPQDKFLRKRVAVFYRPLSRGEAIKKATGLRKNTGFVATASRGPMSEFEKQKIEVSQKMESALVQSAEMTRFAIEVTVTFEPNERAYREALQKLKTLLDGTNLAYRFVETGASAAFHSTLPLGILPWEYEGSFHSIVEGSR